MNQLFSTKTKLFLARILYRLVHFFYRSDSQIITRNGINYKVDLSEGIDLSIFLFGNFQKHVYKSKYFTLSEDAVILDVGANIGMMSLQFSRLVPSGRVYAFEPTYYAFSKLQKNLELNPMLSKNIVPIQSFVSATTTKSPDIIAYASWKISGEKGGDIKHQIHGGTAKLTSGVAAISLDDFCTQYNLSRLDFIKIDTDGHEFDVLRGSTKIISKFKPIIIFEIGMYVMDENGIQFSDYDTFFESLDYSLYNSKNHKKIDMSNYRSHIPLKGTIDILALPTKDNE